MDKTWLCKSPEQLDDIAADLLQNFESRILAFYGDMGAGKTTFIKSISKQMLVADEVSSPTFSIVNEYRTECDESIFHFDFYRIKNVTEAMDLGCEEYFYSGSPCLIEWPEKIKTILPEEYLHVSIEDHQGVRSIKATDNYGKKT